jgi:mono/diheme cytochrome c family protein
LAAAASACAGGSSEAPAPEPAPVELVPAYYSAEQAERGRRVFGSVCSVCHSRNDFRGPIFELTWMAEPVGNLFQHISTTMPQDRPGSRSLEEYASVVAYMLEMNGRPAGRRELPADADALSTMRW